MDRRRCRSRRALAPADQRRLDETAQAVTVALARHEQARGRPVHTIARELGVPLGTLRRWLMTAGGGFRPVAVAAVDTARQVPPALGKEAGGGLVLITLHGHRIEGLDLAGVIAVVSALEAQA